VFQYKIAARPQVSVEKGDSENEKIHGETASASFLEKAQRLEAENDFNAALGFYEKAHRQRPESVDALLGMANCCARREEIPGAETWYRKALEIDPHNPAAWFGIGLLRIHQGIYDEAIRVLSRVVESLPDHDKAWCGLAIACRHKGMPEVAMNHCIRALKVNDRNMMAIKLLLELSYEQNRFGEVETILRRYLQQHPANVFILFGLAGIQYKQGKLEEARENLERVLVIQPGFEDAVKLLGRIGENAVSP